MKDNVFKMDTKPQGKKAFLDKISVVYIAAMFLTGFCAIFGVEFLVRGIVSQIWKEIGVAEFAWKGFFYLNTILILVALIKVAIDQKPFSRTLTWILQIIGILFIVFSVIMPRLSGYQTSEVKIMWIKEIGTLCDGMLLIPGLLFIILSRVIGIGFNMQKEMDEIL